MWLLAGLVNGNFIFECFYHPSAYFEYAKRGVEKTLIKVSVEMDVLLDTPPTLLYLRLKLC